MSRKFILAGNWVLLFVCLCLSSAFVSFDEVLYRVVHGINVRKAQCNGFHFGFYSRGADTGPCQQLSSQQGRKELSFKLCNISLLQELGGSLDLIHSGNKYIKPGADDGVGFSGS